MIEKQKYSVLVVDDEAWHRRGMKELLKQLYPHLTLFEARNGQVALEICQTRKIDIVITDISMPNMDGLELACALQGVDHKSKIVILTAYNKFEYAKKALKYGVADFILKPVNVEELQEVLQKLFSILEQEYTTLQKYEQLQTHLSQADYWWKNHLVNQWLSAEDVTPEIHQQISQFMVKVHTAGGIILFQVNAETTNNIHRQLARYLEEHIEKNLFHLESDHTILVTCYTGEAADRQALEDAIQWCKKQWNLTLKISVGRHVLDLLSQAPISYRSARSVQPMHFYEKSNPLYGEDMDLSGYLINPKHYYRFEKEITQALSQGSLEEAVSSFHTLLEQFTVFNSFDPHSVRHIVVHIIHNILDSFHYVLKPYKQEEILEEIDHILLESNTISKLSNHTQNVLRLLFCEIETHKQITGNRMDQIATYINTHYAENITLNETADHFSFHPAYFSTLFKDIFDTSFTDYVLALKMEKAKEFLTTPSNRIGDIAEKLGYNSPGYFSRAFKKYYGITPEEYQKRHCRGTN